MRHVIRDGAEPAEEPRIVEAAAHRGNSDWLLAAGKLRPWPNPAQLARPLVPIIAPRKQRQALRLLAGGVLAPAAKQPRHEAAMSPLVVGSALGAAALTVGRGAAAAMGNGLSFAGELLRVSGGAAAPKPEDEQAATQRARTELHGRIAELAEQIRRRLAAAGINLLRPVELMTNGLGGIAIAMGHPQQAAIEEALGRDVLLERDFNRLASDYGQFVAQHGAADLPPTLTVVVPTK